MEWNLESLWLNERLVKYDTFGNVDYMTRLDGIELHVVERMDENFADLSDF